ncbi:MAG: hypothetical protein H6551_01470 [Chitinophagales bacterium]|nr:hypothetical protein [Chitinophagaceae bacterium]MCB9063793.1 hypothetical protein [Chitinophagales bacterium]
MTGKKVYDILFIILASYFVLSYNNVNNYCWDLIGYLGVIYEYDNSDIEQVHSKTFNTLKTNTSSTVFNHMTSENDYKGRVYGDINFFEEELSFYRTKPLYTATSYILYKLNVPVLTALRIIVLLSSLLLLIITYYWLSIYNSPLVAIVISLLLGHTHIFADLQTFRSPDATSNMLIMLSLFFVNQKKKGWIIIITLCLAVLARIDNVILAALVAYFFLMKQKRTLTKLLIISLISPVGLLLVPYISGNSLSWFIRFKFLESYTEYYFHVLHVLRNMRGIQYLLYAIITVLLFVNTRFINKSVFYIIIFTMSIHLILFPSLQERLFVAYEFVIIILLTQLINSVTTKKASTKYVDASKA